MAADGDVPKDDVRARLPELDKQKADAKQELAHVTDRRQRAKELDDFEAVILSDPEDPYVQIL